MSSQLLPSTARVVVIGGGAMGVSLLYHLARLGWADAVLLEQHELTAGSTWHAAGLCTHFAHHPTIMQMRAHSVRLYREELTADTGEPVGYHACGALRVTRSPERLREFHHVRGIGAFAGYDFHVITPAELAALHPLTITDGLVGAIYEPLDGHVDPSQAVHAMAAGARQRGARIHRRTAVEAVDRLASGEWRVRTQRGDVIAEHVVNAAGTWCREVGQMLGLDLPVVPMLHQYLVTDRIAAVASRERELPMVRDPDESWYVRQERDGLIVGPYEKDGRPWAVDGVPAGFGMELLPPDLDRVEHIVASAMARVPALADAGIKTVVNGPITFTPDGNPLIGPAFGLRNAWLLTGSSMGVMEGGGAGRFLAEWIVEGEPPQDALAVDARRFGGWANRAYRVAKAVECFGLQFGVHYPFEERPAGRPALSSPLQPMLADRGAVMGFVYGWERPNYFTRTREAPLTFSRPSWFETVARECRTVSDAVGICDLTPLAKLEVTGADAAAFMASLGANPAPRRDGRIALTHVLSPSGGIEAELTVTRFDAERFYVTGAAGARRRDGDLLRERARGLRVEIDDRTEVLGVLAVAGPRAIDVLAALGAELTAMPWLSATESEVAGVPARVLRVAYAGEWSVELHVPIAELPHLYGALLEAGARHGIGDFGAYALNSLRLEKGFPAWGLDLGSERTPLEAGLSHLVRCDGRRFVGRDPMLTRQREAPWALALLSLAAGDVDAFGLHGVYREDDAIGLTTSGGFGHRTGLSLAFAWLRTPPRAGERLHVEILGERVAATPLEQAPYDPRGLRMRVP